MSQVVTDFARDYVAKYGAIPSPAPTETKPPSATQARRSKKKEE
ncbi:hypothetical protein [Microcoleus sp. herbarium12]